ncbi:KLTH0D10362p [Lachancea thermotolerans CBS 6340]|uniref:KLTH0D10362p n=1 Tax=Lachancea thermotolerans (strain ATCC 56472 / CBS 6340 / NRRL Y-8284) TaxID=559295 RepID=C5DEW7_LACTC|nr:KLTH0D10362p [Lachancea thermotolerans CBS 6340]CAR22722.1 KLTH0D10362p [Lachancea thermotolerans CBS 6340]
MCPCARSKPLDALCTNPAQRTPSTDTPLPQPPVAAARAPWPPEMRLWRAACVPERPCCYATPLRTTHYGILGAALRCWERKRQRKRNERARRADGDSAGGNLPPRKTACTARSAQRARQAQRRAVRCPAIVACVLGFVGENASLSCAATCCSFGATTAPGAEAFPDDCPFGVWLPQRRTRYRLARGEKEEVIEAVGEERRLWAQRSVAMGETHRREAPARRVRRERRMERAARQSGRGARGR